MVEMNWDTNETWLWITNDEQYYTALQDTIGNELYFMTVLYVLIQHRNEVISGNEIDSAKVNGNELYVLFSELCGNEQEGWK